MTASEKRHALSLGSTQITPTSLMRLKREWLSKRESFETQLRALERESQRICAGGTGSSSPTDAD